MVEAQEASAGETIPAEMVAVAENRLSTFDSVQEEISQRLNQIKEFIYENVQSTAPANPTRVLTNSYEAYMERLSFDQLNEIFRQDRAHWVENTKMIKRQTLENDEEMKKVWKEKFTLKKIPMDDYDSYGNQSCFEWPTD